jgi:hypothetical protein
LKGKAEGGDTISAGQDLHAQPSPRLVSYGRHVTGNPLRGITGETKSLKRPSFSLVPVGSPTGQCRVCVRLVFGKTRNPFARDGPERFIERRSI